jgi:hypothetical protein
VYSGECSSRQAENIFFLYLLHVRLPFYAQEKEVKTV